jgi:uncharacterized protein (TIGR00730 family)
MSLYCIKFGKMISSVAIFCGSGFGKDPVFRDTAEEIATLLAEKNVTIIYGGGNAGLMGIIANTALNHGGNVVGIIPEFLNTLERKHDFLTQQFVVNSMHERKNMLYQKSDAAIILPGGLGTLDELFEMLTWNQLTIHDKNVVLLNIKGFYDHLLEHLLVLEKQGSIREKVIDMLNIATTAEEVIRLLFQ